MDQIEILLRQLGLVAIILGLSQAAWNVTCDLDLENIEAIVEYLPIECQEIYKTGATSELYAASLAKSKKFQDFQNQLDAYERKESQTPVGEVKCPPKFHFDLKFIISPC